MGSDFLYIYFYPALSQISIHTPRMGSDLHERQAEGIAKAFQSTLPAWGVTKWNKIYFHRRLISIHTPRMGSDKKLLTFQKGNTDFNPHSPHGE